MSQSHWVANLTDATYYTSQSIVQSHQQVVLIQQLELNMFVMGKYSANAIATLDSGDTITDGTLNNDVGNWYHYTSYSGESHWC